MTVSNMYKNLEAFYTSRADPHIGRRYTEGVWVRQNKEAECFELIEVSPGTKWEKDTDGEYKSRKLPSSERAVKVFGRIHADGRFEILAAHSQLWNLTNPTINPSICRCIREFTKLCVARHKYAKPDKFLMESGRTYQMPITGTHTSIVSNPEVKITKISTVPAALRKEINAKLKNMRQLLTVRIKLGAIDFLKYDMPADWLKAKTNRAWGSLSNTRQVDLEAILEKACADDLESLEDLFTLMVLSCTNLRWGAYGEYGKDRKQASLEQLLNAGCNNIKRRLMSDELFPPKYKVEKVDTV